MATMTPAALLVGFCLVMTAIAVGRLALEDERNPVDIGTTLVVSGITLLAVLWVTIQESLLSTIGWLLLAIVALGTVGAGVLVISRHWNAAEAGGSRPQRTDDDADGERDCA
jgi:hypothetical protein